MIFFKKKKKAEPPPPTPKKKEAALPKPKKEVKEVLEKTVPPTPKISFHDEGRLLTAEGHFRRMKRSLKK